MSEAKSYSATTNDNDREVAVNYNFGSNLKEATEMFGEEVVFSRFHSAAVIDLQSLIRRGIKAQKSDSEIQQMASAWRPGVKTVVQKDPKARAMSALDSMSDEERQALLAEYAKKIKEQAKAKA